jgi:hypothetical protein
MKYEVTQFKNLQVALKELEPFIRNGKHLETGRPFKRFGRLLSRELLGNMLVCVVANHAYGADRFTFVSSPDDIGGDGIIRDTVTGETWPTEHVLVPEVSGQQARIEARILTAIASKQAKGGAAYASGKTLVVFLNSGGGQWFPDKVARQLPEPLNFESVWVVGLQSAEGGRYTYTATQMDKGRDTAANWRVRIGENFDDWDVTPVPPTAAGAPAPPPATPLPPTRVTVRLKALAARAWARVLLLRRLAIR